MIAGDKKTALKEPHSLVITESAARKYFSSLDIIGKTVIVNGSTNYKITGVIKDIPPQSHFNFDLFMPACELEASRNPSWMNYNFQTYVVLKPGTDVREFEKQFNTAFEQYLSPEFGSKLNTSVANFKKAGNYIKCSLMPLTDIHLNSHLANELGINGSIQYVYLFSHCDFYFIDRLHQLYEPFNCLFCQPGKRSGRTKGIGQPEK